MNRDDAVKALDAALTKMREGGRYTTEDVDDLERCARDVLGLLKAQEPATVEPKRNELANETKAWLDRMDAVDALNNIADICIDWDGYRTADGLGGLINEIWAYARYCADRIAKTQEPVEPKMMYFVDEGLTWETYEVPTCGVCGALLGDALFCPMCGRAVKWE